MVLGIILVLVGIGVEYMFWNLAPAWYHILFVLFLFPMTVLGGKLRVLIIAVLSNASGSGSQGRGARKLVC